jgi:hypothetical protein
MRKYGYKNYALAHNEIIRTGPDGVLHDVDTGTAGITKRALNSLS